MESVLVVGAGALGCELLSILLRSTLTLGTVTIVDPDTIELSNLSRQLLYGREHIGQSKAQVACQVLSRRHPDVQFRAHQLRVEEMSITDLLSHTLIFSAVDQMKTRLWLNALVLEEMRGREVKGRHASVRLIDTGIEGWMGHVRLVIPGESSCLYCTKELYSETNFTEVLPLCTLAGKPSRPEQCIGWALSLGWPRSNSVEFNPAHQTHLKQLLQLAQSYGHPHGVSVGEDDLDQALRRRLLPNILSMTALIAALAVLVGTREEWSPSDDTFWFVNGQQGLHWTSMSLSPSEQCHLCHPSHGTSLVH